MQNASLPEIQVATELNCQYCGWPLIKDGKLMCNRCDRERPAQAALGRERFRCSKCWDPPVTLTIRDQAVCPKCGRKTLIIKEEKEMVGTEVEVRSKTKELQEWLDREIRRVENDVSILRASLSRYETDGDLTTRYKGLTSEEIEVKVAEDRKKLEQYKKRLEFLQSAREFKVDIEALEKDLQTDIRVGKTNIGPYLRWTKISDPVKKEYTFHLGSRELRIEDFVQRKNYSGNYVGNGSYTFKGVTDVLIQSGCDTQFCLQSGQSVCLNAGESLIITLQ